MARKVKIKPNEVDLDLTPMIDIIFLLIIFFILAGRITSEMRVNDVTVPPTKTAEKMDTPSGWRHIIVETWGKTQTAGGGKPLNQIKLNTNTPWPARGTDDYTAYQHLREALDEIYIAADKRPDPLGTPLRLPNVVLEIRADREAEYRLVQEIMQVASDSVDPFNDMKPKAHADPSQAKPFVNLIFSTFKPGDK